MTTAHPLVQLEEEQAYWNDVLARLPAPACCDNQEINQLELAHYRLPQLERAIARVHSGRYGVCEECGSPIDRERLKSHPETAVCVACVNRLPRRRGRRQRVA